MSIEFLYNRSFDDFELSTQFYEEYNRQYGAIQTNIVYNWELRFDKKVINIVKQIGLQNAQGKYSRLAIKEFPIEFKDYIDIHEYDGCEKPYIIWEKYLKDKFLDIDLDKTTIEYIKNIQSNLNIILKDDQF
jgi:hypothetical protein